MHAEPEPRAAVLDAELRRVAPRRAAPERPSDVTEAALPDAPSHCEAARLPAAFPPDGVQVGCDSVRAEADAQQVGCDSVQADLRESQARAAFHEELQPGYAASRAALLQACGAFHAGLVQEHYCALPAGSPDAEQQRYSHAPADAARC